MTFYLWLLLGVVGLYFYLQDRAKNKKLYEASNKIPGPPAYPILGSSLEFIAADSAGE